MPSFNKGIFKWVIVQPTRTFSMIRALASEECGIMYLVCSQLKGTLSNIYTMNGHFYSRAAASLTLLWIILVVVVLVVVLVVVQTFAFFNIGTSFGIL